MSTRAPQRTRPRIDSAPARLFVGRTSGAVTRARALVAAVLTAVAAVLAFGSTTALADGPILNPYFKDRGASGAVNSGTDLSGWTTSAPGQVISTWCYVAGGQNAIPCVPESGTTIPVVGLAGSPSPSQSFIAGGQGVPGIANKTFRSTDIYNGDAEWKAGNPFGSSVIPQQSNYALIPTSCQSNQPAPNSLSQSFYAYKDQIITGFSFFTSLDWVPDRGTVTITAPDGSVERVFRARITGDSDQAAEGSWDHPVPPTVHQNNQGTWVMPHGQPADDAWIASHAAGVSGTPWTRWAYRFPEDGTYTVTATARESTDSAFPVDCNMPSLMGLQFQTPTPIKDGLTVDVTPTSATYGDAPFSIAGKASVYASRDPSLINPTGKGVTFSTTDPDCTVTSAGKVTILKVGDGTCNVTVRAPGDFYYYAPESKNLPITVNPKALDVDAPDLTKTYGSPNPDPIPDVTLRESDLVNGDTLDEVLDLDHPGQPDCSIDSSAGPNVGVYADTIHCDGGTVNLTTPSPGDRPNYDLQPGRAGTLTITKADQSITLPTLADKTFGDGNVDPGASASSGLPVAYASATPDVCTITNDGKVHIEHPGTCAIIATQDGNQNYNPADPVAGTFDVARANQTVTFGALSDRGFGDGDFTVSPTASSGLGVKVTSLSTDVCTVDDSGKVHILAQGQCLIAASQDGDRDYNAAETVVRSFNVSIGDQEITFPAPSDKTWGDQDFDPGATASSGLPVTYTASGDCEIVDGKVHIKSAGTCTVTASQDGNDNYDPAEPASRTFQINKAPLTVTADDKSKTYGDPNPDFSSSVSGLVGSDTTSGAASCDSSAGQSSPVGTYAITCSQGSLQAGDNYDLEFVDGTLTVNKANQSVAFPLIDDKFYGQDDFNAGASASSGLPVTYSATGDCTVDPSTGKVHLQLPSQWPGSCTITASQDGNGNYNAATPEKRSFQILTAALDGGGIFAIGNLNASVGTDVNWWGSQWWKKNSLTGGSGPGEFKGYIDTSPGYPPRCGDTWTTRPGNSSKPPASVPQYMTVVVSSNITKSGPTISGDVQSVVVVRTDAGYDSNPGHPGTGTVIAKICGNKVSQTINFSTPADRTVGSPDFDPGATATSGLPVSYSSSTQNVCTIAGGKVHLVGVGNCTVTASQGGNDVYSAASDVTRTFAVNAFAPVCTTGTAPKGSKVKCESLLVNPSPGAGASVKAGQTLTIGYTDEDPIGTGALAPTAQLSTGEFRPVSVSPTSGLPQNYVNGKNGSAGTRYQSLLSFALPANLSPGSYSVLVTVYDDDGDMDQWNWPVTVVAP